MLLTLIFGICIHRKRKKRRRLPQPLLRRQTISGNEALLNKIIEDLESEEVENGKVEGTLKTYFGKRYERNPKNRKRAIEIHGIDCYVCGFNFEEIYGERGKDFIEVHHLQPLSTLEEVTEINPETDLVPLCANCHRMIHRNQNHEQSTYNSKDY